MKLYYAYAVSCEIEWCFRYAIYNSHDLEIRNVGSEDEGQYWCQAQNVAGVRRSPKATLTLHGK